jgi:hypothetical protein
MNPFSLGMEKVGLLVRCKQCSCRFRVFKEGDGKFAPHEEPTPANAPTLTSPPAPTPAHIHAAPPQHLQKNLSSPGQRPLNSLPAAPLPTRPNGASSRTPLPVPRGAPARGGLFSVPVLLFGVLVLAGLGVGGWLLFFNKSTPGPSIASLGRYGGVEIGSTGVKMLGVEYYQVGNEVKFRMLGEPMDVNTNITDIPEGQNDFDSRQVERTMAQVRDYFEALRDKRGVPAGNIFIACSSGVLAKFKDDDSRTRNRDRLVQAIRETTGKTPDFIDAHAEAKYSLQAIVPREDWNDAVLVDVGGENIKGGGFDKRGNFYDFSAKVGVKAYEKKIEKGKRSDESFADAAQRLRESEVEKPLHKELAEIQDLRQRKKVYILGGIAWAMETYTRPEEFYSPAGDQPAYHRPIAPPDFAAFDELLRKKQPKQIREDVLARVDGKGPWVEDVSDNLDKIQKEVFKKQERLIGGAQVLIGLATELDLLHPQQPKELFGFRYGHIAWLLGYVGDRSGHRK